MVLLGLRDVMAKAGLGSKEGGNRMEPAQGLVLPTLIPRARETCQSQPPSFLKLRAMAGSSEQSLLRQSVAPSSPLQGEEKTQRLQERDPDPPFSLPEPELKECPVPASQPHCETEQDVLLIKDTWEAFIQHSFPGLDFILNL